MAFYPYRFAPIILAAFLLIGCSAPAPTGETPLSETAAPAGGTIELAVSETCATGSDPKCVPVGSGSIVSPATFERAQVSSAVVAENQKNAVEVTFTDDGAAIFGALTQQAAQAGPDSRLVFRSTTRCSLRSQ